GVQPPAPVPYVQPPGPASAVPVTALPAQAQGFGVVLLALGDPAVDQAYYRGNMPRDLAMNGRARDGDTQSLYVKGFNNDAVPLPRRPPASRFPRAPRRLLLGPLPPGHGHRSRHRARPLPHRPPRPADLHRRPGPLDAHRRARRPGSHPRLRPHRDGGADPTLKSYEPVSAVWPGNTSVSEGCQTGESPAVSTLKP